MRGTRLPKVVPFHPGAKFYSAAQRTDMMELALDLRALRGNVAATVAATLIERRVMWPGLAHRFFAWVAGKRGKTERLFYMLVYNNRRTGEKLTRSLLENAARWAVDGVDREERTSVGGFSQREVNFIAGLIHVSQNANARVDLAKAA
jgi:hypothetical protein